MRIPLTQAALAAVANAHPSQVWAFVCSSRSKTATVVEAHISVDTAKRHARMLDGCTRMGRVDGAFAETF